MNALLLTAGLWCLNIPDETVRASVDKGIKRLEAAGANYIKNRTCFSCHHQTTPMLGLATAKEHGFAIDQKAFEKQAEFTINHFKPKIKDMQEGRGIGGANTTIAYALLTLRLAGYKPDEMTDAMVEFLLKKQQKDGAWTATTGRPPSEGSAFTTGGVILDVLKDFGGNTNEERSRQISKSKESGLEFLLQAKPKTTEDRVFLLFGLVAAGAGDEAADLVKQLVKQQRPDGGWAQLDNLKSDAYATGSVLVALRKAGMKPSDEVYRKGVRFLVLTQLDNGGWIVQTRSRPIQTFFDNGDPGGKSQFISTAATGWAITALAECFDKK